jgi:hypothetical protein
MTADKKTLKLGKGSVFVKSKLLRLNQDDEIWEADFRVLPKQMEQAETSYLGVVVALPHSTPMALMPLEYTPDANDLADLLAKAMQRPYIGSAHRPQQILLRENTRWAELLPHLRQLGIEVTTVDELPHADEECVEFQRQMRRATPDPVIVFTPKPFDVQNTFPSIARWVEKYGHIEIGDQDDFGFVVRALDYGGLVFEDVKSKTFSEAMQELEAGLSRWLREEVTLARKATRPITRPKAAGEPPDAVSQELRRVLEDAMNLGVPAITLEYVGRELRVFYRIGNLGVGGDRISNEVSQAVMDKLAERTGPGKKSRGTLPITLAGKQFTLQVEKLDSFGKSAFRLSLDELNPSRKMRSKH